MKRDGDSGGGGILLAAPVVVVLVLPSRVPVVRHHAPMLVSHAMWNRFQYVSAPNLSLLDVYLFACLYVHGHWVVIFFCSLWSRPRSFT